MLASTRLLLRVAEARTRYIFSRPLLGRPNKAGLKYPSVRPSVRAFFRACVRHSKKRFFNFNEIWHVCRGRRVMQDGMQCDPIQGQGQGHEPFKVGNLAVFKRYLLRYLQR